MAELKTYSGGCHCGAVRYEVDAEIAQAIACNCSIYTKHGLLLAFARGERPDGAAVIALNLRCFDGLDLAQVPVRAFDVICSRRGPV
jgi:hypothetical protein